MRRRACVVIVLAALLLQGCASGPRKQLSREEWIASTSRVYSGITREQAIAAAERVLRLADGDDFQVVHSQDGFDAVRDWMAFAVIVLVTGKDYWSVRVMDDPGGVKMTVQSSVTADSTSPTPTTSKGTWVAASSPMVAGGRPVDGPALYELFFARVDYLLGLNPRWSTCEEANARSESGATWGANRALCNSFNMTDDKPDKPMLTASPRPVVTR